MGRNQGGSENPSRGFRGRRERAPPVRPRTAPAHATVAASVLSVLDGDERADRRVGPHLGGGGERELDAAEALRRAEARAGERVDGVAVVEVADPADAGVVVVGAVRVRAAHRPDRDVLEDREGAELGRCRRHARVPRRAEDRAPVVPEGEGLRHVAVDVDVAVAVGALPPGDRVGEQGVPDLRPDEGVDVEAVVVLEHHHRAADDLVPLRRSSRCRAARAACSRRASGSGRPAVGDGGELGVGGGRHRIRGRGPADREVARLRQQLLEPQDRPVAHVEGERSVLPAPSPGRARPVPGA